MSGFSAPGVSAPVSPQAGPTASPHLGGMPASMGSGFFGGGGAGFHPMMGGGMPGMMGGMGGFGGGGGGGGLQPQPQQHFGPGSMMAGGNAGPRQRSPGPPGEQTRE